MILNKTFLYIIFFVVLFVILALLVTMFILQIRYYKKNKENNKSQNDRAFSHYLLYDDEKKKYIIKEFDDSIIIVGTYCNTQTGEPLIIIQTQGWIPKENSLGSKISHYGKTSYVITEEYIFQDEQSAILQAIKLNNII